MLTFVGLWPLYATNYPRILNVFFFNYRERINSQHHLFWLFYLVCDKIMCKALINFIIKS